MADRTRVNAAARLVAAHEFFRKGEANAEGWSMLIGKGRGWESAYTAMVPLTIACLTMALALGLGTGAVFKLVAEWFPDRVGTVTGVVGAAGGLGGFFPPLVMGVVKSATGGYAVGFVLMALVAVGCLAALRALGGPDRAAAARTGMATTVR
jgi:nitrate/nitrite transporter NarK